MKSYKSFLFLSLVPALALTSCYHEFPSGGGGGGGGNNGGNSFVSVLVTSTPSPTFNFPALYWVIGNISITDSAGAAVSIGHSNGVAFVDFNRIQADSVYLGNVTLPATTFTSLQVEFNSPLPGYLYNNTGGTLFGGTCAIGTVCLLPSTVPGYSANTVTVPINLTLAANSNTGLRVNFDLSKAVTNAGADGITFDFTQSGAITVIPLPTPTSLTISEVDTMDNFTGTVTAVTATTVTVTSGASEPRTFDVSSTAEFDDPFTICPQPATLSCLAVNQNISIDGVVNPSETNGQFTAYEVEFLDPAPLVSELEGIIITPVTNNQFNMVLSNGMGTLNELVTTQVTVVLNGAETYLVDPKGLFASPVLATAGFQSQTDLVLGQTVMLQGGTINNAGALINSTRVLLRYSSIGGGVANPSGTIFNLTAPAFTTLGSGSSVEVQTFPNTVFDNVTSFAGLSGVTYASVRALYLNPNSGAAQPLLAAKVRTH